MVRSPLVVGMKSSYSPLKPLPAGWTEDGMYFAQAAAAILLGVVFTRLSWRGPLEWVGHTASLVGRGGFKALS